MTSHPTIRSLLLRLRCYRRTQGLHQLDIAMGRCAYCKREWTSLHTTNTSTASAESDGREAWFRLSQAWRRVLQNVKDWTTEAK